MPLLAGVAVLAAATAFASRPDDGFPARSERLPGTPVELRVQDGVTSSELDAIRAGILIVHRFIARTLDSRVRGPVEARIAHEDSCRGSDSGERSLIGEGGAGYLCVDTQNVEWDAVRSTDRPAATAVSGHEYVHVWQSELGCLPSGEQRRYRWLVEGMASGIAWRALVQARRATPAGVARRIRREGDFDANRRPLRAYEREGGRPPQYALWHLAIRALLRGATRNGAAPQARPEVALRGFCRQVGEGTPWRTAFARSFGLPPAGFYARFEAVRP